MIQIIQSDNLPILESMQTGSIDLIYIDPPFNTGRSRSHHTGTYEDDFADWVQFMRPRIIEARRLLKVHGSLFLHIDHHEAHHARMLLDHSFGADCFVNEIIWAYDYGGRPSDRFPCKHDNIYWYARYKGYQYFDSEACDRLPYMAPALCGEEKAARGKLPTDVWWQTIVCGGEKTGYPTQKPVALLRRIVLTCSRPGAVCLDFFAGSGTLASCVSDRDYILIDDNPQAIRIMEERYGIDHTNEIS